MSDIAHVCVICITLISTICIKECWSIDILQVYCAQASNVVGLASKSLSGDHQLITPYNCFIHCYSKVTSTQFVALSPTECHCLPDSKAVPFIVLSRQDVSEGTDASDFFSYILPKIIDLQHTSPSTSSEMTGELVFANGTGCHPQHYDGLDVTDAIVMVDDGDCSAEFKVHQAEILGATGVVVRGDTSVPSSNSSVHWVTSAGDAAHTLSIPAIYVNVQQYVGNMRDYLDTSFTNNTYAFGIQLNLDAVRQLDALSWNGCNSPCHHFIPGYHSTDDSQHNEHDWKCGSPDGSRLSIYFIVGSYVQQVTCGIGHNSSVSMNCTDKPGTVSSIISADYVTYSSTSPGAACIETDMGEIETISYENVTKSCHRLDATTRGMNDICGYRSTDCVVDLSDSDLFPEDNQCSDGKYLVVLHACLIPTSSTSYTPPTPTTTTTIAAAPPTTTITTTTPRAETATSSTVVATTTTSADIPHTTTVTDTSPPPSSTTTSTTATTITTPTPPTTTTTPTTTPEGTSSLISPPFAGNAWVGRSREMH